MEMREERGKENKGGESGVYEDELELTKVLHS